MSAPLSAEASFPGRNGKFVFTVFYSGASQCAPGTSQLMVINPNGTGKQALTSGSYIDQSAAWSPNGREIAFSRVPSYTGTLDQSPPPLSGPLPPSPFPLPSAVVAASQGTCRGVPPPTSLEVMNANGSGAHPLTSVANTNDGFAGSDAPVPAIDLKPTWSPNGRRIAFIGQGATGSSEIDVIGADGSNLRKIPGTDGATYAFWSPDGTQIAFQASNRIVLIRPNGSHRHVIATNAGPGIGPNWSPDGKKLLYGCLAYFRQGGVPEAAPQLCIINRNGSGKHVVVPHGKQPVWGVWSPDGTEIAYVTLFSGTYVVRSNGTHRRKVPGIATNPYKGLQIDWQPLRHG